MLIRKPVVPVLSILFIVLSVVNALALSKAEKTFLSLYFTDEELVVLSATRSLTSVARIAENVSVVTAEDIELMNAHTVAEALYNVPGIEMIHFKGPGSGGLASIHGSDSPRVTVLLDGVPLMNPNNSVPLAALPVQMIRKIEIIKGPASATWGSSFGGVINIITKSIEAGEHTGGMVYASGGERRTSDLRAEITGRKGGVGLYVYGGTMNSGGLIDRKEFWHNNFFSKVSLDAGQKTSIDLSFLYHKSDSINADLGMFGLDVYDAFALETIYGRAALQTSVNQDLDLNLSVWGIRLNDNFYAGMLSSGMRLRDTPAIQNKYGLSGGLTWYSGGHTIVAGTDLTDGWLRQDPAPNKERQRKVAVFINDTVSAGKFTMIGGLRYDHADPGGNFVSPSLGMTCLVTKDLLLRAVVSRGFHDPAIAKYISVPELGYTANKNLKPEKIWSFQAGAETNLFNVLSAKLTLFHHETDDIILDEIQGPQHLASVNGGKGRTTGGELEITTQNNRGFVLKGGIHYERVKTGESADIQHFKISNVHGINAALAFNADNGLRAMLKGHYLWWNVPLMARYNGVVVDFNVIKDVLKGRDKNLDIFFTAHNIFNASSYSDILHKNPNRWIEAGMRYTF